MIHEFSLKCLFLTLRCLPDLSVSTYSCKHLLYQDQYFSPSSLDFCFPFLWHYLQSVSAQLQVIQFLILTKLVLFHILHYLGASFCYLLSYLVGRKLVRHYLPDRAAQWSAKVDSHRSNLLSYILFLRITPFLPNWFINIVSPVIGVPLLPFWMGTFFGVAPPSFIFIQVIDWTTVFI